MYKYMYESKTRLASILIVNIYMFIIEYHQMKGTLYDAYLCSMHFAKSTHVYVINNLSKHLIFLTRIFIEYNSNACVYDCFTSKASWSAT